MKERLNELIEAEKAIYENKVERIKKDYIMGMYDCKNGVYDKWYRYCRDDNGRAYDIGWEEQNKTTMNESIKFIEVSL